VKTIGMLPRFKIAHKLLASSALILLPLLLLLGSLISGYGDRIAATGQEIEGLRRLDPLRRLAGDVSARAFQSRDREGAVDLASTARRIDAALADLEKLSHGDDAAPAARLKARWQRISGAGATPAETAAYREFGAAIQDLIRETGDSSGLVLDPEMDSYSLVELGAVLLPLAQATVADAALLAGEAAAGEGRAAPHDLSRLAIYGEMLEISSLPQLRHAAETSVRADAAFHGVSRSLQENLPPAWSRYEAQVSGSAEQLRRFATSPDSGLTAAQVAQSVERTEQAGAELWRVSLAELGVLLQARLSDLRWNRAIVLILGVIGLTIIAAVVTMRARMITAPLEGLVALAGEISAGRIKEARQRLKSGLMSEMLAAEGARDEICLLVRAIAQMTANLDSLLMEVGSAGRRVAGSAVQIASAVRQLETAVTEQASSTNEVSATSREISTTAQDLARTMSDVSEVAQETAATAGEGIASLGQIHATMQSLTAAGEGLSAALGTVAEKARSVDEVITAITKIANRTNLLSLNAAIEAEKAGNSGGFPVVALEIRRLADQTAVAALDIEQLVQEMQAAVREGVTRVEQYAEQTRASSSAMAALSSGLERIIGDARKLGPQFEDVNQGMQLQAQGAGQISESMGQLREAAQQTRESLAEFHSVAGRLRETVDTLQAELGKFSTAGA
jgi:methyl-accepting chemotaxis protein